MMQIEKFNATNSPLVPSDPVYFSFFHFLIKFDIIKLNWSNTQHPLPLSSAIQKLSKWPTMASALLTQTMSQWADGIHPIWLLQGGGGNQKFVRYKFILQPPIKQYIHKKTRHNFAFYPRVTTNWELQINFECSIAFISFKLIVYRWYHQLWNQQPLISQSTQSCLHWNQC